MVMVANKGLDNGCSKEGPEQRTYWPPLPLVFELHREGNSTTIQNKIYQWSPVTRACEFDRFTPTDNNNKKKNLRKFELLNVETKPSGFQTFCVHGISTGKPAQATSTGTPVSTSEQKKKASITWYPVTLYIIIFSSQK